ncbi:MAG: Efflux transporter, family [Parcubacteria group bacterium]|nr:Efflux transporter, family [Parcubacteria group bacterium]
MAVFSFSALGKRFASVRVFFVRAWKRYRALALWVQGIIALVVVALLVGAVTGLMHLGAPADTQATLQSVTLSPVSELSGNGSSVGVIGSVRSITEASILAQSGGTVTAVHTRVGANVPAGFVIAELDNASQRAAVLQAEGSYDAAVAARAGTSPVDIATSALNTYTSAYNSLDSILKTSVDTFYGDPGAFGPKFLTSPNPFDLDYFPKKRGALSQTMNTWRGHLASASSQDAPQLLAEADANVRQASALVTDIATAATKYNTDANATQLAALATARSGIAALQASITAAKQANQSQGTQASAGADASVKIALGTLRGAQANLEKTLVRAPIAGQVNFLPSRVGDYVTAFTHVATVAQNGALEIVTYISEDTRTHVAVGMKVTIEDKYPGVITSIAPALDPVTKQIEMHVAVDSGSGLVNGQSVRIGIPSAAVATSTASSGPLLLPLTAVKLTPSSRVVFSVGADGTLVAQPVDIGDVHGDRIEVLTKLPADLRIVTDARGLSEGQKVSVATSATP